jgi:hypothetical protein
MPVDLSGATQADVQPVDPATGQVIVKKAQPVDQTSSLMGVAPDMMTQDPNTFAALTAHRYMQTTYDQGLSPTGDDVKKAFSEALGKAQDYHKTLAEEQEKKNLELQQRGLAVTSGITGAEETAKSQAQKQVERQQQIWELAPQKELGGESPLTLRAKEQAAVEKQKTLEIETAKQGPEAAAETAAYNAAHPNQAPVVIQALPDKEGEKLSGIENGYAKVNDLQDLHAQATESAAFGGVLKNRLGAFFTQPGVTSDKVRTFFAAQHAAITPLAIGLLGDTARAATMPGQQENMLHNIIPDQEDNIPQAGQKIFLMKQNMIQQLQAMHDQNYGKYATTKIDRLLAQLHSDFDSHEVQKWNPFSTKHQDLVQVGDTAEGKAQVAAGATRGVQRNQTLQGTQGQLGSELSTTRPPTYTLPGTAGVQTNPVPDTSISYTD